MSAFLVQSWWDGFLQATVDESAAGKIITPGEATIFNLTRPLQRGDGSGDDVPVRLVNAFIARWNVSSTHVALVLTAVCIPAVQLSQLSV